MFRDFTWRFWVIGLVAAVIIGIPVITGTDVELGLDLQGGTMLTYRLLTDDSSQFEVVLQVLWKRLNVLGLRQLVIRPEGPQQFVVQVPGVEVSQIERIKYLIQTSGQLWFKIVAKREDDPVALERILELKDKGRYDPEVEQFDIALREDPKTGEPLPKETPASYTLLENQGAMPGRFLSRAFASVDEYSRPAVGFRWNPEGARLFGALTEKNRGRKLAIVLDGVLKSAPVIQTRIGVRGQITGKFTQAEVNDLVIILQGGSLPSKPIPESDLTVGPGLGRDSIERGNLAIWISLALVIAFTIVYYRGVGIVAALALLFNLALLVCTLIDFEATLTLPGIAGIVLTVGMAIDANILIFERIREEKNKGMGIRQAIENGYGRAFWTIFDANLTTLITALILFQVGTGPIKGFAVTLSIGILTSLFSALFVTKTIFALLVVKGWVTEFRMLTLVRKPNFDFRRYQRIAVVASTILIVTGMVVFVARGQGKYGIEFTGGALFHVKLRTPMHASEVRARLAQAGPEFADSEVQAVSVERKAAPREGQGTGKGKGGGAEEETNPPQETPEGATGAGEGADPKGAGEEKNPGGGDPRDEPSEEEVGEEEAPVRAALPGREGYEFQIRVPMVPREVDLAKARRDLERTLGPKVEEAALGDVLDRAFGENTLPGEIKGAIAEALAGDVDRLVLRMILEDAFSGTIDPSELKPMIDDAFEDVLAPPPFPEMGILDGVKMDPDEPGWGRISLLVRLDPRLEELPDLEKLGAALAGQGFGECAVEEAPEDGSGARVIHVTTGLLKLEDEGAAAYRSKLTDYFKGNVPISEPYAHVVDIGKSVAHNLKSKAVLAMVFAIFAIVLYITFRFEFKFGLAAIVALVHDVLFALGTVACVDALGLLDLKIDLAMVTAFLTIIGYSLNDTIVVFDRIRETLHGRKKMEYDELVNTSINQTLSRTLLTSITTFVALIALFLAGVNVIRDFSFAMIIGVVIGTYSSIFIASPVLIYLRNREVKAEQ